MAGGIAVRLTANFERNLGEIEAFLIKADAPQAYDRLLDELLDTVIPNLERFPPLDARSSTVPQSPSKRQMHWDNCD